MVLKGLARLPNALWRPCSPRVVVRCRQSGAPSLLQFAPSDAYKRAADLRGDQYHPSHHHFLTFLPVQAEMFTLLTLVSSRHTPSYSHVLPVSSSYYHTLSSRLCELCPAALHDRITSSSQQARHLDRRRRHTQPREGRSRDREGEEVSWESTS